jgi:ABC-type antimicrobial peptide transport system permease subunit
MLVAILVISQLITNSKNLFKELIIGLVITFFAGYIPAKKAANVDPVEILRK